MQDSLRGLNALVCGASKGIGRATALALADRGARVCLLARDSQSLKTVESELSGTGHKSLSADLSDLNSLSAKVQELLQAWGGISILVCNSGGPKGGPLLEAAEEDFVQAFKSHVLANQRLVQLIAPNMKEKKYGRIINVISTSVKAPIPNLGVSNTIRGAVASWSKTLASELGPFGITVNNVLPGFTQTERLETLLSQSAKAQGMDRAKLAEDWKKTIPARRFAEASETADAIAFLASPQASYINGINLPVDGGRTVSL